MRAVASFVLALLAVGPGSVRHLGDITDPRLPEISGIAASRQQDGIFWVHNDSGDAAVVYAVETSGRVRSVFRVTGAQAVDWEDLAIAGSTIYVGDVGDNVARRDHVVVYRFPEPGLGALDGDPLRERTTAPAVALRLTYPDGPHDAEAVLVHPRTGHLYILTKEARSRSGVYRFGAASRAKKGGMLRRVGELRIPHETHLFAGRVTAGDISPDGTAVVLRTYLRAYELRLPSARSVFDTVWSLPLRPIDVPQNAQGEAIGYRRDGRVVVTTSEGLPAPLDETEV